MVEKQLSIKGDMSRHEIRRKVILEFLEEEAGQTNLRYYVETLRDRRRMFLERPTRRFDFDFKVQVERWDGKGTHDEIINDLLSKKRSNPSDFQQFYGSIKRIHSGEDSDKVWADSEKLRFPDGMDPELLLKLLKWMFILEDVYYWNYEGRNKLMNAIDSRIQAVTIADSLQGSQKSQDQS